MVEMRRETTKPLAFRHACRHEVMHMGGKPSKQTPADKRLTENKPKVTTPRTTTPKPAK